MVFYEIAARKVPFESMSNEAIQNEVKQGNRPEIPADCDASFKKLIEWCWAQEMHARPTTLQIIEYINLHVKVDD